MSDKLVESWSGERTKGDTCQGSGERRAVGRNGSGKDLCRCRAGRPPSSPVNQSGPYGPSRGYGNEAWRGPIAPGPASGGWQRGQPKGGYSRPAGSNQSPGVKDEERPFLGVCNLCQVGGQVGHRAAVCPDVICFWCRQKGHTMRNCLTRSQPPVAVLESCQVCDAPNVTFKTCMRCAPLREKLGNRQVGGQMK